MKNILFPLISTREGWLFRQVLKVITVASASFTAWLVAKGADASTAATMAAGVSSALSWAAESGLSKLASKIATP